MMRMLDTSGLLNAGFALPAGINDTLTRLWFRGPATTAEGQHTDWVYIAIFWFCTAWFVLLMGLMFYWVVRYRRRPGTIAPASPNHSTKLEIVWTVVPTLCLVPMFIVGFQGYMHKMVAPGDAIELSVSAYKWNWDLEYPNGSQSRESTTIGSRPVPIFYMPADRPIKLRMNSRDVMHAFWVPDFRIKADIMPNRYTSVWFNTSLPADAATLGEAHGLNESSPMWGVPYSDHWVFCAEYCGNEHSEMAAVIRVVPEDKWNQWLGTIGTAGLSPIDLGKFIYQRKCASCHTIDGSKGTGPTWLNKWGYESKYTDGSTAIMDENSARESILVPAKKIVEGYSNQMTSFQGQIKDNELEAIFAYMKSLSNRGGN
jgi:cytochrome c oxidase subunit II